MSERTSVDVNALLHGGVDITHIAQLAHEIAGNLSSAVEQYQHAGGTGEMGEQFEQSYKPGEEMALRFLRLLNDTIGESGDRTLTTGRAFADASGDAETVATTE